MRWKSGEEEGICVVGSCGCGGNLRRGDLGYEKARGESRAFREIDVDVALAGAAAAREQEGSREDASEEGGGFGDGGGEGGDVIRAEAGFAVGEEGGGEGDVLVAVGGVDEEVVLGVDGAIVVDVAVDPEAGSAQAVNGDLAVDEGEVV